MKQEIRQNGIVILYSKDSYNKDDSSIQIIFNNLTGKNFSENQEYQSYIKHVAITSLGFTYGKIELIKDGKVMKTGQISRQLNK